MFSKKIMIYFNILFLLFVLLFSTKIYSQEENNNRVGLNIFNTLSYWEGSSYTKDRYDYLGIGTFFNPFYKYQYNKISFQLDLVLSNFPFTGPDELTETPTDDDADSNFDSNMKRSDIELQMGYSIFNSINLLFATKYYYMCIEGDNKFNDGHQKPYNYTEKGILFGPGININLPNNNSESFVEITTIYLINKLNYSYLSHRIVVNREPYKNKIDVQLLTVNVGYNFHIVKNFQLGISLKTEYSFKTRYEYGSEHSADLWFIGLNTSLAYKF